MRKFLLLPMLLALPMLCWASWAPSVSAAIHYHGSEFASGYDSASVLRHSAEISSEISLLAYSSGRHRIALPVALSYISGSQVEGRTCSSERYELIAGAEYGSRLSERFSLALSLDARVSYFPDTSSTLWRLSLSLKGYLDLTGNLSLLLPVSLITGQAETAVTAGLGLCFSRGWQV